jgi:hypothetical protein
MLRSSFTLPVRLAAAFFIFLQASPESLAASQSRRMPVVSKWGRFEQSWKSTVLYSNAVQDVSLTVLFRSPLGDTHETHAFWDEDKVWRVRFTPDQPGRWSFTTTCSDAANKGLHNQLGEFMCTAADNKTRFTQHGPIEIASGHKHFRHADGTPFFWLADTVSNGARASQPRDWEHYARTRASQRFTAAQWVAAPGLDYKKLGAFSGKERIVIHPEYFKRLDEKLAALTRAGLLSAIVPLAAEEFVDPDAEELADDQVAVLARYMISRWSADPVAWVIPLDPAKGPQTAALWKRIGNALFANTRQPVIVLTPQPAALDSFRDQGWIDGFSTRFITEFTGPPLMESLESLGREGTKENRPLMPVLPADTAPTDREKPISTDNLRRACYWSFLSNPTAGISYATPAVVEWNTGRNSRARTKTVPPSTWEKSLFLPAIRQLSGFAKFVDSIEFWRLQPQSALIANQPGLQAPQRFIAGAATENKDLSLIYVPEDRTLELALDGLPPSPTVAWLNPRTGENSPAVAVVGEKACQFPTPDPGDWLLVLKAGR